MFPFYLGIDLHLKRTYLVLMDHEGEVIDKRRLKNTEIETYISRNVPKETYAVMEATRNWPFSMIFWRNMLIGLSWRMPKVYG